VRGLHSRADVGCREVHGKGGVKVGGNVVITIFGDFRQFSDKILAFFFLPKLLL
jgi:hypothetical protein